MNPYIDPQAPSNVTPMRVMLTVEEAAMALGLGRTAIFEQVRLGRLKSVKVGRSRRIPLDCLVEFVEMLKAESEDAA
jgi:excisionase family DNA binding protein